MTKPFISVFAPGISLAALLFFAACGGDSSNKAPDVSHISVPVKVHRFDQDLFALDTANLQAGLDQLAQKHPDFLPFFLNEIAHDQTNPNETPIEAIAGFVTAPQVRRLNDSCQATFSDLTRLTADLEQMLRYYRYHFPERPLPQFTTAVTEFVGDAYAVNDSTVMIGLDMFLGEYFSGYNPDYFPQYLRRQFDPKYVPIKVALALASHIVGPPPGERIIDYMVNNGKVLHVMDLLLPEVPESTKMGYTQEQLDGCYANEQGVWARLLELNVLHQPLNNKNQKIVMPSPSTDIVFQESPGEIGNWVGWQVVKAYLQRYPETTVQALLSFRDSQQFLEKAKYKPKRTN
ncbi:MAG: hypothetical protein ABMA02_10385 [Saprospiraceae bacterium]